MESGKYEGFFRGSHVFYLGGLQQFLPCVFRGRPFATVCHAQDVQVQKILETRDIDEAQAHEFHLEVRLFFTSFCIFLLYIFVHLFAIFVLSEFSGPVVLFLHLDFMLLRRHQNPHRDPLSLRVAYNFS